MMALQNGFFAAAGNTRVLPHSLEAEERVLSCCFLDGREVIARCILAGITPASFYEPNHAIIFAELLALYGTGHPTEISVVAEALKPGGKLDQIGGFAFLTQVSSKVPT